jgi:hypothetical protein
MQRVRQKAEEEAVLAAKDNFDGVNSPGDGLGEIPTSGRSGRPIRASRMGRHQEHEGFHGGHTGEVLVSLPGVGAAADQSRSRSRRAPIVTVENTIVRITLPEGFGESDWKRLKEEAQKEEAEEEEYGDSAEEEAPSNRGYVHKNEYEDEERDEFDEEEDAGLEEEDDSDGDDIADDDNSDLDDFENNQATSLGKRMTARQLSMAKRAEQGAPSQVDTFAEDFEP